MTTPAGWYDDPQNPQQVRFYDGQRWTEQTAPRPPAGGQTSQPQQPSQPAAQQGYSWQQPGQGAAQPGAWTPYGGQSTQPGQYQPGQQQPDQAWQGQAQQFQTPVSPYTTDGSVPGFQEGPDFVEPPRGSGKIVLIAVSALVVIGLAVGAGIVFGSDKEDPKPTSSSSRTTKPTPSPDPSTSAEPSTPADPSASADPTTEAPSGEPSPGAGLGYEDLRLDEGFGCTELLDEYIALSVDDPDHERLESGSGLTEVENTIGSVTVPSFGEEIVLACEGTGTWGDGDETDLRLELTLDSDEDMYVYAFDPSA